MLQLFSWRRPDSLRLRVEAELERGTGLHREEWLRLNLPLDTPALTEVADDILDWCRERMAETRRPYGIDQMALAVACAEPGSIPLASKTFGVFRPVDFYREDGIAERVRTFVEEMDIHSINRMQQGVRFAAALFSWGDVAKEAIFSDRDRLPPI